jgi:hypothetical protein
MSPPAVTPTNNPADGLADLVVSATAGFSVFTAASSARTLKTIPVISTAHKNFFMQFSFYVQV